MSWYLVSLRGGGGDMEENVDCSKEPSNALDPPKCENSTGPSKPPSSFSGWSNEGKPEGFRLVLSELNLLESVLSYDSNDPKGVVCVTSELEWKLFPLFWLLNESNAPKFDGCFSSDSVWYSVLISLSWKDSKELKGGGFEFSLLAL